MSIRVVATSKPTSRLFTNFSRAFSGKPPVDDEKYDTYDHNI